MTAKLHREAAQIISKLRNERILELYHFTSIENLTSIQRIKSLCSKATLEHAGAWPVPQPGGNKLSHDLDKLNDNWNKLALNLTPHTPMIYHKKQQCHLCLFVIKLEVAGFDGVIFTDSNATKSGQQRLSGLKGLDLLNFEALRSTPRPWDREGWVSPVQAEVLVPDGVDFDKVKEVAFVSMASLEEAERLWGGNSHPKFVVAPQYFSDAPGLRNPALNFSYLKEILLTDRRVDKTTVGQITSGISVFRRSSTTCITAITKVRALAGTKGEVVWNPAGDTSTIEFETQNDWLHWPSIELDKLPSGRCSMDYKLGDIRWATVQFRVL